jgi:hypothetical protein
VYVLVLIDEGTLPQLLDLKTKEELEFTHHPHLKSECHQLGKLLIEIIVSQPKDGYDHT